MSRFTRLCAAAATGCAAVLALSTPALGNVAQDSPAAPNFSGAIALSNCSGSVVRWQTSQASDKALVLTNGHCYDFMGAHEVVVNKPSGRSVTLLSANGSTAGTVSTVRLLYATMSRTDVALYQLSKSYRDLQSTYGVPAFTLASTKPAPENQAIQVLSGYWKIAYNCNLNGFAYRLHEDVWTWRTSLRYSDGGCQVIGGTSGSPVLDSSRTQIGINNTINENGRRCTINNPCEEDRNGNISVHLHRGYGQETWIFYTCLSNNLITLSKPGCRLPSP